MKMQYKSELERLPPPPADDNTVRIASGWQGDVSELLNGILDEVTIFGVALTVDQIAELMNDGIKKAGSSSF